MKQRSFHLSRGGVNQEDGLLEARPPLYEGHSSICEGVEIFLSKEGQDPRPLIKEEIHSHVGREEVHRRTYSAAPLEEEEEEQKDQHEGMMDIHPYLF